MTFTRSRLEFDDVTVGAGAFDCRLGPFRTDQVVVGTDDYVHRTARALTGKSNIAEPRVNSVRILGGGRPRVGGRHLSAQTQLLRRPSGQARGEQVVVLLECAAHVVGSFEVRMGEGQPFEYIGQQQLLRQ